MEIVLFKRPILLICLLVIMMGLSYYGKFHHPWLDLKTCLENPTEYHGRLVTSFDESSIGSIHSDGFLLLQKNGPSYKVLADTAGLKTGEFVGLTAVFHQEGYLRAVSLHVAQKRRMKMWISVIPALLVGILLIRSFKINWRNKTIEVRKNA